MLICKKPGPFKAALFLEIKSRKVMGTPGKKTPAVLWPLAFMPHYKCWPFFSWGRSENISSASAYGGRSREYLSSISVSVSLIVLIMLLFVHTVDHRLFRQQCCMWCNHGSIATFCRLLSTVKPFWASTSGFLSPPLFMKLLPAAEALEMCPGRLRKTSLKQVTFDSCLKIVFTNTRVRNIAKKSLIVS